MKKQFINTFFVFMLLLAVLSLTACATGKVGNDDVITSLEELNGKTVGVQTGTLYEDGLYEVCPDVNVQFYAVATDLIKALEQGKIDAYLTESSSSAIENKHHPWMRPVEEPIESYDIAFGLGNGDKQELLKSQINEFIAEIKENGEFDEMYDYWVVNYSSDDCFVDKSNITGENGKITVAVEGGYEPYSYIGNGELQGYDVDFIMRFCRAYGYTPVFYEIAYDAIASGLESGKFDIGANLLVTEERGESVQLSDPYNEFHILAMVAGPDEDDTGFFASLKTSIYKTFLKEDRWKLFAQGALTTFLITLLSIILGTILGFIIYLACKDGNKIANSITDIVVWLVHGTPTVVLLMILYYIIFGNSTLSGVWISIVGFSLIFGCSVYDMLVSGVMAVGKEQVEGARALGYSKNQTFFIIILPQAAQYIFSSFKNEIVSLIKETSVVGYIAVLDLTKMSDMVRSRTFEAFFPLISTAVIYFVLAWVFILVVKRIEFHVSPKNRSIEQIAKGIEIKKD